MKHLILTFLALCGIASAQSGLMVNKTTGAIVSPVDAATFGAANGLGGSVAWGTITGTLSSQTDLATALGLKAPLASPTFTGSLTTPNLFIGSKQLTIGGYFTTTGTSAVTLAMPSSGTPTYTFPASTGTIASLTGVETFANKSISLSNNTLTGSSAQLAVAISDETGSGSVVFSNSPTLVTPVLGTPASGNAANLTNLQSSQLSGALPAISGASLTSLNASQLTSGTVPAARLAATTGVRYVAKNGNDGTALLGQITAPYLTIGAAITAASSGETVFVAPGNYDQMITLKNGVNLFFAPGATIITAGSVAIDVPSVVTCSVAGDGIFRALNAALLIEDAATGSVIDFNCQEIGTSFCAGSTVRLRTKLVSGRWYLTGAGTHSIIADKMTAGITTLNSDSAYVSAVVASASDSEFFLIATRGTIEHHGEMRSNNSGVIQVNHANATVYQYGNITSVGDTPVEVTRGRCFVWGNVSCTNGLYYNWEGRGCGIYSSSVEAETTIYGNVSGIVGCVVGFGKTTIWGDLTSTAAGSYLAQTPTHDTAGGVTAAFYPGDISGGHAAVVVGDTGVLTVHGRILSAYGNAVRMENGTFTQEGSTITASASGSTTGFPFLSKAGTINLRGGVSLSAGSGVSECFSASGATTLNVYGATTNKGSDSPTNLTTNIYGTWMIAGRALGEYISSYVATGSAVSLTTATVANITSISLTAGEWDVESNANFNATTATITAGTAGINTTSATLPTDGSECYTGAMTTLLSSVDSITVPRKRVLLTAPGTVYLSASRTFSAGIVTAFGGITARRIK